MLWAKGVYLAEIISKREFTNDDIADEIEDTIEILQNMVSYKVPLLLKPIFDNKNQKSIFLSSMQAGANNPVSKKLIEIGVPRGCALYLKETVFEHYRINDLQEDKLEKEIRKVLEKTRNELPYWIRVQLDFLG